LIRRETPKDVASEGCVVDKINELTAVVDDASRSISGRRLAWRSLMHCIEDVHQLRHQADNHDTGGNSTQVRWYDRGSNMHPV
jgi:hypothetical protein